MLTNTNHLNAYFENRLRFHDVKQTTLENLNQSCHALVCAAYETRDEGAKFAMLSKPKSMLSYNINNIVDLEFQMHLEELPTSYPHYLQSRADLFRLYYLQRNHSIYRDHEDRLIEIYNGLSAIREIPAQKLDPKIESFLKSLCSDYASQMSEDDLLASAEKILALELIGRNPCSNLTQNITSNSVSHRYPFQMLSISTMKDILTELFNDNTAKINDYLQEYSAYREQNIHILKCRDTGSNGYTLKISAEMLQASAKATVCFINEEKDEIARFELSAGKLRFHAYGSPIDLTISGQIKIPYCIFENTESTLKLSADFATENAIYIAADTTQLTLNSNIQSPEHITLEASGQIDLLAQSRIASHTSEASIQAYSLKISGEIYAKQHCDLVVENEISMADNALCYSENSTTLSAKNHIICYDQAKIEAKEQVFIKTNSFNATDKAKLCARNIVHIETKEKINIDKEAILTASELTLKSKQCDIDSPYLSANIAHIHGEEYVALHSNSIIKTLGLGNLKEKYALTLSGDNVWNAGQIDFGPSCKIKVNKICTLGLDNLSDLEKMKQGMVASKIKGNNLSITAGIYFYFFGGIEVDSLNVSAIAEINVGPTKNSGSQKSHIFELDLGINIPNIDSYRKRIARLISHVEKGEYGPAMKILFIENIFSIVSATRSLVHIIAPAFNKSADLGWSLLMTLSSCPKIYKRIQEIRKTQKFELSDMIELCTIGSNLVTQGVTIGTQVKPWLERNEHTDTEESETLPIALTAASAFLPAAIDDSILGISLGSIQAQGTLVRRSFYSYEAYSARLALNLSNACYISTQDNTVSMASTISNTGHRTINNGLSIGLNVSHNIDEDKEAGSNIAQTISWQGKNFDISGETIANSAQVTVENLHDAAHINAKEKLAVIAMHTLERSETATAIAEKLEYHSGSNLVNAGSLQSTATSESPAIILDAKDDVTMTQTSHIIAPETTVLLAGSNINDGGISDAKAVIEHAVHNVNLKNSAQINTTDTLIQGEHTSLNAMALNTDNLALNVDDIDLDDLLLNPTGHHPRSLLAVSTSHAMTLNNNYHLDYSLQLKTPTLDIYGNLYSHYNLGLYTTSGNIHNYGGNIHADETLVVNAEKGVINNERGNFSANMAYVHSLDEIHNLAGIFRSDTQLSLISDMSNIVNEGELHDGVYDGACIQGGIGDNNVGLIVKSGGILFNTGSVINSQSDAIFEVKEEIDTTAVDYTTVANVTTSSTLGISSLNEHSTPTIVLVTNRGNITIPTSNHTYNNAHETLRLDATHGTASVITPPNTVAVTIEQTAPSEVKINGTLSAEINNGGWNNVRSHVFADTILAEMPNGNMNNIAGSIQGKQFVGIRATNINNITLDHTIPNILGGEDKRYEVATIVGGNGKGHDGVGMVLQANDHIRLLGSIISSEGSNVLMARLGIDSIALHNTYISYHRETDNGLGRRTETTEYSERVQQSVVFSANGSNYMISQEGNIYSVSTNFLAARDNYFIGKHNIDILGLVTTTLLDKHVSTLYGINDTKSHQADESKIPTVAANPGNAKFYADDNVRILCGAIMGQSSVEIDTKHVEIGTLILNHLSNVESRGLTFDTPLLSGLNALPLYQDIGALFHSNNPTEYIVNTWNVGVDSVNAFNNMVSGLRNQSSAQTLFNSSSLTGAEISYGHTKSSSKQQTVAQNVGINCGDLHIRASESVEFKNGVTIETNNTDIVTKKLITSGAELKSANDSQSVNLTLGVTLAGGMDVGGGANVSSYHATQYSNQVLNARNHLSVTADEMVMRDANWTGDDVELNVNDLSIISDADTSVTRDANAQVSSNGSFSLQAGSGDSHLIGSDSGITANRHLHAKTNTMHLQAGYLVSNGDGEVYANEVDAKSVEESANYLSLGTSSNLSELDSDQDPEFEPSIPTANVSVNYQNYKDTQNSTIFLAHGDLHLGHVSGVLNTTDASGKVEEKDESVSVVARVPTAGLSGVNKVGENYDWVKGHVFNLEGGEYKADRAPVYAQEANDASTESYRESKDRSSSEQNPSSSFIEETRNELNETNLNTNIDTNAYSTQLSEIASDDRLFKPERIDYLTQPDMVEKLAPLILSAQTKVSYGKAILMEAYDRFKSYTQPIVVLAKHPDISFGSVCSTSIIMYNFITNPPKISLDALKKDTVEYFTELGDPDSEVSGRAMGRLLVDTTVLVAAGGFGAEAKAASGLERIGLFGENAAKTGSKLAPEAELSPIEQLNNALQQSNIDQQLENIHASSVNAAAALKDKLSALQDAKSTASKIVDLPSGLKFYGKFRPAKTSGPSFGSRFVIEYNYENGKITMLNEVYNENNIVNRISLKNINGLKVKSQHFPPTPKEITENNIIHTYISKGKK